MQHQFNCIRSIDQLLSGGLIHADGEFELTAVYYFFKLFRTSDSSNKIDSFISSRIFNPKNRLKNSRLQSGYIKGGGYLGILGFGQWHRPPRLVVIDRNNSS